MFSAYMSSVLLNIGSPSTVSMSLPVLSSPSVPVPLFLAFTAVDFGPECPLRIAGHIFC